LYIGYAMKHELCSRGIILKKHFPKRLKISLIDESYGHIGAVPSSWQWASYASIGALISYDLFSEHDIYFIKNIELISIPLYRNESTMLFFHHMLEICYFCVPIHGGQHECFQILLYVIQELEQLTLRPIVQKLFLAKLLFVIGQYPQDVDQLRISKLLDKPNEYLMMMQLNRRYQKELELFIYQCVQSHPYGRLLRTVNFLSQVGR